MWIECSDLQEGNKPSGNAEMRQPGSKVQNKRLSQKQNEPVPTISIDEGMQRN
jgi:hypothetical protein